MRENVLNPIVPGGYFAGGFFGPRHAWASNPDLSIVTKEQLTSLFEESHFHICEMQETIEAKPTATKGDTLFHTIQVIAQKEK